MSKEDLPRGKPVGKMAHDVPSCGSSDALQLFEQEDGSITGWCFSCKTYVPNPLENGTPEVQRDKRQYMDPFKLSVAEIYQLPSTDLPHRSIRHDIVQYYGVKVGFDPATGNTIKFIYYPKIVSNTIGAYKRREVATKAFTAEGKAPHCELFGQLQAKASGAKRLYVTEGEDDTMALFQALLDNAKDSKWAHLTPAVVSLPDGAGSVAKSFSDNADFLRTFEEIVLVFDDDQPGKEAIETALKILPLDKVTIAKLPAKDPCAMLEAGKGAELAKICLWKTEKPRIASVVKARDYKEEAKKPPVWGAAWPWRRLSQLTYGIRDGSIIGIGAGVGVGKSSFFHQVLQEQIFRHGKKCGLFMLEEPISVTLKKLASKEAGIDFTDPELGFTQAQLDEAIDLIPDDLCIYKHGGVKDWEDVKQSIRHMFLVEDVTLVIIDPLTALVSHLTSSEANDALNKMFGELASMIEELKGLTVLYGAHLNPPKKGPSHEEGGRVVLMQFTGSKAMIKWSHYILGGERDTQAEEPTERHKFTIRLLKDRDYGRTGETVQLRYDEKTRCLVEDDTPPPVSQPVPVEDQPVPKF